jgi:hypothetical protein
VGAVFSMQFSVFSFQFSGKEEGRCTVLQPRLLFYQVRLKTDQTTIAVPPHAVRSATITGTFGKKRLGTRQTPFFTRHLFAIPSEAALLSYRREKRTGVPALRLMKPTGVPALPSKPVFTVVSHRRERAQRRGCRQTLFPKAPRLERDWSARKQTARETQR